MVVGYNRENEDGMHYRFMGIFVENGKFTPSFMTLGWKKMIAHPFLTGGMFLLRFLVGVRFLMR